jgi:hypothetical protein
VDFNRRPTNFEYNRNDAVGIYWQDHNLVKLSRKCSLRSHFLSLQESIYFPIRSKSPAPHPLALRTGCGCSCAERGSGSGVWGEAPLWLLKYNFRIMQGMLRNYIWRKRMEYNKEMKAHYCRKLFVSWLSQWLSKFVFTHFLPFLNLWTFPLYHLFQFFENILNRHFLWCKNVFLYMFMVRESIYLSVVRRIIPPDNKLSPLRYMISISLKFGCGMLLDIEFPAIY